MEVCSQGCRGNTLLHYAVWRGNLKMCKFLLRLGMDPYLKNSADFDAFTYAAHHRQYKMLLYLLTECKYPKNKPIQFFSLQTEKLLREKLQESNGYDYLAEFHALMASEQLLGPRKGERVQALRAAAMITWLSSDLCQAWDVYCRLLQCYCSHPHTMDTYFVTGMACLLCRMYAIHGKINAPFREFIVPLEAMFRYVIQKWHSVQRTDARWPLFGALSSSTLQELFLHLLNLLELLHVLQSEDNPKLQLCLPFEVKPSEADTENTLLHGDQTIVSLRLHGRWELFDVVLLEENITEAISHNFYYSYLSARLDSLETVGLKMYRYLQDSDQPLPTGQPLPLQCIVAQLIQEQHIEFEDKLPAYLCTFVQRHKILK